MERQAFTHEEIDVLIRVKPDFMLAGNQDGAH